MSASGELNVAHEYLLDAWQRWILSLDLLRQRGNNYHEHKAQTVPHVLQFKFELVHDGRSLPRPVNYALVRIVPPKNVRIDPTKSPFIIVDPRAGHGPGIGGMKADSEIGVAINAGHPCYYIGFLPEPLPGQTIEDVCIAEAIFIKKVIDLHPIAETKPVIIANCQAGWQTMITAALNPNITGPIILAGSPLSYWPGVRGKNPLRYLGGVLGGSWLTTMTGDMGNGIFDGAHLVANFESLDPANTYWGKPYNVYSKVDTEGKRFLDFELWWGSPVLLNAGEIQWIVDNLFIGNKLTSGSLSLSDGQVIDLRNIRSPIIVFCSWGDNITPPPQALGWITDLYQNEEEIAANEQTIVYTTHDSIGHLGIFVSGKVATKEHHELTQCMDLIYLAPPGLYEAVITDVGLETESAELAEGEYLFRLEARTLDDIRALGANTPEDERRFATAARVSEANSDLYRRFAAPFIRAITTEKSAKMIRNIHPNRLRFALFSDQNPLMKPIGQLAEEIREARTPVSPNNPFLAIETAMSSWITATWDVHRNIRDSLTETLFLNTYGSSLLQAVCSVTSEPQPADEPVKPKLIYEAERDRLRFAREGRFESGGLMEALARAWIYVNGSKGAFDERGFNILKKFRAARPAELRRPMSELRELLKEQIFLDRLDQKRAIAAIPKLLPKNQKERQAALEVLHEVFSVRGTLPDEAQRRLARIDILFTGHIQPQKQRKVIHG
jgi:hypothetical protein